MTGEDVRALRLALRWTRAEFGELVGVSPAAVKSWECGYRGVPKVGHTRRALDALLARDILVKGRPGQVEEVDPAAQLERESAEDNLGQRDEE